MRALMKQGKELCVSEIPVPAVGERDVLVSVQVAGLCRTDVLVAEGLIPGKENVILGHEFSGVVEKVGSGVRGFAVGNRVTAMPVLPCGVCTYCTKGRLDLCQHTTMLGVHRDGAFSQFISVPSDAVYKMPQDMPFRFGAYTEPVAAALSVLKAGIRPDQKGVIYGDNRFGILILRILKAHGFEDVDIYDPRHGRDIEESAYDFAIETQATAQTMQHLFTAIKPCGTIVLKSRKHELVGINFFAAVQKEITMAAVNYGDFKEAIRLMAEGILDVDGLLGDRHHALEDFHEVFQRSKTFESQKIFFNPYK